MSEYVYLVSIEGNDGRKYIRTAPLWSNLHEGDEVMFQVEAHPFEIKGTVIDLATFNVNNEEYKMLQTFARDIDMKVTKKIEYTVYTYEEEGDMANG